MHPKTREAVEQTVKRYKPPSEDYYYGLVILEKTVIAVVKNNPKIHVAPTGKILLICSLFQEISTCYYIT